MYLDNYQNHLSYITSCEKYNKMFKRQWDLKRHYTNCYERTKYIFPGGFHRIAETILDKLESLTIYVPESHRYYLSFAVWDMEAVLMMTNTPSTDQMHFLSRHVPVSVSVSSNVEEFYVPKCFVDISLNILISKMMSYLIDISSANFLN